MIIINDADDSRFIRDSFNLFRLFINALFKFRDYRSACYILRCQITVLGCQFRIFRLEFIDKYLDFKRALSKFLFNFFWKRHDKNLHVYLHRYSKNQLMYKVPTSRV